MRDKLDAETVARGLSLSMCRAIIGDPQNLKLRGYATRKALDLGLVRYVPIDAIHNRLALTQLGLAVRAILKGE